jgi:hypothetical protein
VVVGSPVLGAVLAAGAVVVAAAVSAGATPACEAVADVLLTSGDPEPRTLYEAYARFEQHGCDAEARNTILRRLLETSRVRCRESLPVLGDHLRQSRLAVPPSRPPLDRRIADHDLVAATRRSLDQQRRAPDLPPVTFSLEPDAAAARQSAFADVATDGIHAGLTGLLIEIDRKARRGLAEYSVPAAIMDAHRFHHACLLASGLHEARSRLHRLRTDRRRPVHPRDPASPADQGDRP